MPRSQAMMSDRIDPQFVGIDAARWPVPSLARQLRALVWENRRLSMSTFTDVLADLYVNRPAFFLDQPIDYPFFAGAEISFRTLQRFVNRAGNALRALGVERGDRIGLVTRNRVEMAFAEFGAQKIGAVPVPMNSLLRAEEIQQIMADCGARVLLTDRAVFEENVKDRGRVPAIDTWVVVSRQSVPGCRSFADEVTRAPEELEAVDLDDSDLAVIFYTAGTTGFPKGAMLSNGGLMFAFRYYAKLRAFIPFKPRDLALLVMPLAHTSGHQALLLQMALGSPTYLMGRFDSSLVLERIEKYRVTMFSGIPTIYRMLLEAGADRTDLSSIETWGGGADIFPDDLVVQLLDLANRGKKKPTAQFYRGYGLTETSGQVTIAKPGPLGHGCIGKPVRGVRVALWDESLRPVPDGEIGEVVIQSPGLMKGYWNNSAMTEETFRGGWFHTGDLARRDASGNYFMAARKKEMIKVGGYSVFPAEVEQEMLAHPDVERVAVVGLPHEMKGERPAAAIVLRAGAAAEAEPLLEWARERIAPYKCPRQIFFVDALPLSGAMKVKRVEVKQMLLERIGSGGRGAA